MDFYDKTTKELVGAPSLNSKEELEFYKDGNFYSLETKLVYDASRNEFSVLNCSFFSSKNPYDNKMKFSVFTRYVSSNVKDKLFASLADLSSNILPNLDNNGFTRGNVYFTVPNMGDENENVQEGKTKVARIAENPFAAFLNFQEDFFRKCYKQFYKKNARKDFVIADEIMSEAVVKFNKLVDYFYKNKKNFLSIYSMGGNSTMYALSVAATYVSVFVCDDEDYENGMVDLYFNAAVAYLSIHEMSDMNLEQFKKDDFILLMNAFDILSYGTETSGNDASKIVSAWQLSPDRLPCTVYGGYGRNVMKKWKHRFNKVDDVVGKPATFSKMGKISASDFLYVCEHVRKPIPAKDFDSILAQYLDNKKMSSNNNNLDEKIIAQVLRMYPDAPEGQKEFSDRSWRKTLSYVDNFTKVMAVEWLDTIENNGSKPPKMYGLYEMASLFFGYNKNKWVRGNNGLYQSDWLLKQMYENHSAWDVYVFVKTIADNGVPLTWTQWKDIVANIDNYMHLPSSWLIPLVVPSGK